MQPNTVNSLALYDDGSDPQVSIHPARLTIAHPRESLSSELPTHVTTPQTINLHRAWLTSANIAETFARHHVPREPDLVTVDVDSADVWLVRALLTAGFRPRVMLVEYNYQFGATKLAFPDTSWMPHTKSGAQWSGSCSYGSSAAVILAAMRPFGYALVNAATGLDLVLVREDATTYQTIPRLDESLLLAMHEGMDAAEYSLNSPMTREEAGNLLDFEIIANGGSVCAARHAAAATIRSLASRGSGCFEHAADLPDPICDETSAVAEPPPPPPLQWVPPAVPSPAVGVAEAAVGLAGDGSLQHRRDGVESDGQRWNREGGRPRQVTLAVDFSRFVGGRAPIPPHGFVIDIVMDETRDQLEQRALMLVLQEGLGGIGATRCSEKYSPASHGCQAVVCAANPNASAAPCSATCVAAQLTQHTLRCIRRNLGEPLVWDLGT